MPLVYDLGAFFGAAARTHSDGGAPMIEADVVKIKELMNHASITTTMRYMHASDEEKRAVVDKLPSYKLGTAWNWHPIVTNEKRQIA